VAFFTQLLNQEGIADKALHDIQQATPLLQLYKAERLLQLPQNSNGADDSSTESYERIMQDLRTVDDQITGALNMANAMNARASTFLGWIVTSPFTYASTTRALPSDGDNGQANQAVQNGQVNQAAQNGQVNQAAQNGQANQAAQNRQGNQTAQNGQVNQAAQNGQVNQVAPKGQGNQVTQSGQASQVASNMQWDAVLPSAADYYYSQAQSQQGTPKWYVSKNESKKQEFLLLAAEGLGDRALYQVNKTSTISYALEAHISFMKSWLLPLLYGVLGASVFCMRSLLNPRIPTLRIVALIFRISLGGIAGIVVAWFWLPMSSKEIDYVLTTTPFAIAFLAGFSIDALFSILDRMTKAVTTFAETKPQ
jgi:hypothetical protein